MFDKDFYPTPAPVIALMLAGLKLNGKTVLEPSAGRADIVKACQDAGASVVACEKHPELKKIVASYCPVIADDFLALTAEKISHIDFIIMNPPFSADERHILHAWEIAPEGCHIRALCNLNSLVNSENNSIRRQLKALLNTQGTFTDIGQAFTTADRKTGVEVALIELTKPSAGGQSTEFEGFFMDEDAEANPETAGLMPYNSVRDLVHRYITAVKIFDEQLTTAVKLNQVTAGWHNIEIAFTCTNSEYDNNRERFKKSLQKSAWAHIFKTLNMEKIATRGLREDINKFVEKQSHLPFTMKNIYRMLEIVIGTTGQRMDKALCEVFDRITTHYHENRYNLEGWKTNSHYLLNRKFIIPRICAQDKYHTGNKLCNIYGGNFELIEDLQKALCWVTGQDYEKQLTLSNTLRNHYLITKGDG